MTVSELNCLISVLVVSYNASNYIEECLDSIHAQDFLNVQLLVCDDGSSDGTPAVVNRWLSRNEGRFASVKRVFSSRNMGIVANLNSGIAQCDGYWIKTIAADDALRPNCLSRYVQEAALNPSAEIFFSDVCRYEDEFIESRRIATPTLKDHPISSSRISADSQFRILLRSNPVWAASLFTRRSLFQRIGAFDTSVTMWEDRPFLLKATRSGVKLHYVNFTSANYRVHAASVQRKKVPSQLYTLIDIERASFMMKKYSSELTGMDGSARKLAMRFLLLVVAHGNKRNILTRSARLLVTGMLGLLQKRSG